MPSQFTNPSSDKELVLAIKGGSKNSFQSLFNIYYKPLVDFCFYRTRNLEAAKDIVQELFTNIWISRDRLDPKKSIKAYLYKSSTNRMVNLAKHSASKSIPLHDSFTHTPNSDSDKLENKIDIFNAIDLLPEKLKTVFMLSRIEGFKMSEIADICNISIKAVEKRMTKALKLLRKVFSN